MSIRILRSYQINTLLINGNWNEAPGKLKQKFAKLTDDDLLYKKSKGENCYKNCSINLEKPRKNYAK